MAYPLIESHIGNEIMLDGEFYNFSSPQIIEINKPNEDLKYYEVIRCINGIPLFLEEHLDRLENSTKGDSSFDRAIMQKDIERYISRIKLIDGNIKIVFTANNRIIHANQFYYPPKTKYTTGVPVGLLLWERKDPNIKAVREDYKIAIAQKLSEAGPFGLFFETLLYGNDGKITEGSRSNVFFIKGNNVLTAPDSDILKGITRKYVLEAIKLAGGKLADYKISITGNEDMNDIDAAFLSGTSIGVLPICGIEEMPLSSSNQLILEIMKQYEKIVSDYISARK